MKRFFGLADSVVTSKVVQQRSDIIVVRTGREREGEREMDAAVVNRERERNKRKRTEPGKRKKGR